MKIESVFFLWRWICSATEFLCLSSTIKLLLFSTMQSHIVHYFVHFVLPCRAGSALYANLSQDCLAYMYKNGRNVKKEVEIKVQIVLVFGVSLHLDMFSGCFS